MNKLEKRIVPLFFIAWGFAFFNRLSVNYAMPVIQADLGLSASDTGLIIFVANVAMAISAMIFGYMSDKQGKRKKFLVPAIFIVGIGSVLSPLATSYASFLIIRAIVGIGLGPILSMIFAITEVASSENKFGANTGYIMAGDALIASILGPVLVTQLMNVMSWQMAICLTGIPTVLVTVLIALFVPEVEAPEKEENNAVAVKVNPMDVFKHKNIIQCILLAILTLGGYFTIVTYAPMFLTEVTGLSMDTMGLITSAMGVVFIVYTIVIPRSTDKFGRKPIMILACFACALAPLLMFLFPTSTVGIVGYIIFGGVSGTIHVFFNTIIPLESLPDELKGTGSTILFALGEIIGSAGITLVAGYIAEASSYGVALLFAAVLFFASVVIGLFLKETNNNTINK